MIGTGADFRMTCRAQVAPTEIGAITLTQTGLYSDISATDCYAMLIVLRRLKFEPFGRHPLEGRDLNRRSLGTGDCP